MPEDKNLQTFDSITKVVLIFALNKFQTHTAIVIRALPEACLIIIKIQTTIFKHSPMPFSIFPIQPFIVSFKFSIEVFSFNIIFTS